MLRKVKMWFNLKLYKFALGVIRANGLFVVRIVEKAGTQYLVTNDGKFLRIGGKLK